MQRKFMSGEAEVIVATNAFGMGIDKADIRFVYHHDVPDSLDSYYQEIGRAGRDGQPSEAVLFFRPEDLGVQRFLSGEAKIDAGRVEQLAHYIASRQGPVDAAELADHSDLSERNVVNTLHRLEDVGAIEATAAGQVEIAAGVNIPEAAEAAAEQQEMRIEIRRRRLEQIREYADTSLCRREVLLRYFGDEFTGPCNHCDNCELAAATVKGDIAVDPNVGTRREVTG